jgi:hypothetical protein
VYAAVRAAGHELTGPVELLAFGGGKDANAPSPSTQPWPFAWPVSEVAQTWEAAQGTRNLLAKKRVLTGADAALARQLRTSERTTNAHAGSIDVVADGAGYALFLHDQVAFAPAIERFLASSDPSRPKLLALCQPGKMLTGVRFDDPYVYDHMLTATTTDEVPCGAQICWNGNLEERDPVAAALFVEPSPTPLTCLGGKADYTSLSVDLQPLIDAFHASYPKQPVELDAVLNGANPELYGALRDGEAEDAICKTMRVDACAQDARCYVIQGAPYDFVQHCKKPSTPLGCGAKNLGCDDGSLNARSPDGSEALFGTTCVPAGWTGFQPTDQSAYSLPACAP